ncbi:MAG: helix-turn-helix domain-containing protein [Janthinobacterium lividum]
MKHEEALQLLGVCTRTLQTWRNTGVIGFSQVGKKIYYPYEEVERLLRQHYRAPFARA